LQGRKFRAQPLDREGISAHGAAVRPRAS
jgi:hypothetical protein